jgi:predicted dehydrogenase
MVKVGVIGIGGMGTTHLDAYAKIAEVQVVAVADLIEERRAGRRSAKGNIKGQAEGGHDFSTFAQFGDGHELIADPTVELVDICVPTPGHAPLVRAALAAGKHVITEKPFALNSAEADSLVAAAAEARGVLMCALCMRFWPAWAWLKAAIDAGTYGKVLAAHFRRVASHPSVGFYLDGAASGGGILDLHIHDTDFVQYCFGMPEAVFSRGYAKPTSRIDHVTTQFIYPDVPMVVAEGGWAMAKGFGFQMQFVVNFDAATAVFDINADPQLKLIRDGETTTIEVPAGMGYEHELRYLAGCIARGEQPVLANAATAARSIKLIEAEVASIESGQLVKPAI